MRVFELRRSVVLPRDLSQVFPFFAAAENLELLTPAFLRFRVLTPPPIDMRVGTVIDYRLRIRGLPVGWQSLISAWEPPHRFIDEQRRGPYRLWVHEHRFEQTPAGTRVEDYVRYAVPGGALVQRLLVGPELQRIFDYRHQVLRERFGASDTVP